MTLMIMKVTTKSSMTTTPMIQIMADQLYRVERKGKGKGKGLPIISSRRKERYHYLIIMLTMVMGKLERR